MLVHCGTPKSKSEKDSLRADGQPCTLGDLGKICTCTVARNETRGHPKARVEKEPLEFLTPSESHAEIERYAAGKYLQGGVKGVGTGNGEKLSAVFGCGLASLHFRC